VCGVSDSVEYRDANPGLQSYGWPKDFPLNDGIFGGNVGCKIREIIDGTSKTLMIGEVAGAGTGTYNAKWWASWNIADTRDGINGINSVPGGGTNLYIQTLGFSSFHPGGCHFGYADGSVTFLTQNIASSILAALTTRSGGEVVTNEP